MEIMIFLAGVCVGIVIGAFAYAKGVHDAKQPTMHQLTSSDWWLAERRKSNAQMQAYLDEQRGKP